MTPLPTLRLVRYEEYLVRPHYRQEWTLIRLHRHENGCIRPRQGVFQRPLGAPQSCPSVLRYCRWYLKADADDDHVATAIEDIPTATMTE